MGFFFDGDNMFKKILSLPALLYGGLAVAGSMGTVCVPGSVSVPCELNQWDFGIQALYLKPAYDSSLGYASSDTVFQRVQPSWGWGYRLEGSYHFDTGSDIDLNWSHYDVSDTLGTYSGRYVQLIPGRSSSLLAANYGLSVDNRYDQVNLVLGQQVNMGLRKHARFHAGLQYAKIRVDETSVYSITNPSFLLITGGGVTDLTNTDFNGVGPVLGIDYSYDLTPAFSITANTAGSLLYGTSRFNFATVYTNGLVVAPVYGSRKMVIPSLEAKLGANYAYALSHGELNLQGGYQVVNYFNALQGRPTLSSGLLASNFGLYGPYLGVKWLGNA